MAGIRKKKQPSGKYRGGYKDKYGKQKLFTGTQSKSKTLEIARKLEDQHRLARLGLDSPELQVARRRKTGFAQTKDEYLAWGKAQGGRQGGPWGATHARNRCTQLNWWMTELNLSTMDDLAGILPRVEAILRSLKEKDLSNKTLNNYGEALGAFCDWAIDRGYLDTDPLKKLKRYDETPRSQRRAMTQEEIRQLLEHCAPHRRLLYETALTSGLRANELRSLTLSDLDTKRLGLKLHKKWTKNQKAGFQPISKSLVERLQKSTKASEPMDNYTKYCSRVTAQAPIPPNPLLYVSSHPARGLDLDLKAAGISKVTEEGKLDFHALRTAFITLAIESGANIKEVQTLARHSTAEITFGKLIRINLNSIYKQLLIIKSAIPLHLNNGISITHFQPATFRL
jgi:integrase